MLSRTNAIKKLEISEKIFDWLCFLFGIINFCPRNRFKTIKNYYLSESSIRKIKNSSIFKKISGIIRWKKYFRKISKLNPYLIYTINTNDCPKYNINHVLKIRYPKFFGAFQIFFSTLVICFLEFEENFDYKEDQNSFLINNIVDFNVLKILVFKKSLKNFFITKESFHLEIVFLNINVIVVIPKIYIIAETKKKFQSYLYEFFENLSSIVVKKLFFIQKKKNLYQNNIKKFGKFNYFIFGPRRFYTIISKNKLLFGSISIQNRTRNLIIYKDFKKKNVNNEIEKIWVFSKNFHYPIKTNIFGNMVLLNLHPKNPTEFNFIIRINSINISGNINNKFLTHIIENRKKLKKSLIESRINFKWISSIVNLNYKIPIISEFIRNTTSRKLNPFYKNLFDFKNQRKHNGLRKHFSKKKFMKKSILKNATSKDIFLKNLFSQFLIKRKFLSFSLIILQRLSNHKIKKNR
jgi:hypothetical protein